MTVLSLALENPLRAYGWLMWHAVGQSHGLLTAATIVTHQTVATVKMLELFVVMVSGKGWLLYFDYNYTYARADNCSSIKYIDLDIYIYLQI